MTTESIESIFYTNYDKFAQEIEEVLPELTVQARASRALSAEEKKERFRREVLPHCGARRDPSVMPPTLLPGIPITQDMWASLSQSTREAIQQYLTLLSFSIVFEEGDAASREAEGFTAAWAEEAMKEMREKMAHVDFSSIAEKLKSMFAGVAGAAGAGGAGGPAMPQIPEKFMKGHIARLAEDIMKEFNPEEFGLTAEQLEAANTDPMRAFQMLSELYTRNPQILQNVMKRIAKRMQEKIQRGQLRPADLAAEAEELMKHFTDNAQFKELLEMFRTTFGFEDPDLARATGNEGSARLSMVRERLRKKLAAKQGGGGGRK
jgi:uncharacterized membrane-anchored protein YhcB (DUF1043 family)